MVRGTLQDKQVWLTFVIRLLKKLRRIQTLDLSQERSMELMVKQIIYHIPNFWLIHMTTVSNVKL